MYIEIGYGKNDLIDSKEIEEQLALTLKNLIKDKIITKDMKLIDYEPIIMDPAYVHISTGTSKKIKKVTDGLMKYNIYTIGRYGSWTYNSMEDSMIMAKELAEKIKIGENHD